jgi:hypothetical protein
MWNSLELLADSTSLRVEVKLSLSRLSTLVWDLPLNVNSGLRPTPDCRQWCETYSWLSTVRSKEQKLRQSKTVDSFRLVDISTWLLRRFYFWTGVSNWNTSTEFKNQINLSVFQSRLSTFWVTLKVDFYTGVLLTVDCVTADCRLCYWRSTWLSTGASSDCQLFASIARNSRLRSISRQSTRKLADSFASGVRFTSVWRLRDVCVTFWEDCTVSIILSRGFARPMPAAIQWAC